MSAIRIVWGSATGPTELAAYDAALAEAGIGNFNLVTVSSVVPPGVPVERVGTGSDLGPEGGRLTVVQARATTASPGSVNAGLGWVESGPDRPGLFYEAAGALERRALERRVRDGLAAGCALREWEPVEPRLHVERAEADGDGYAAAVVCGVYGEAEPIL